MAYTSGSPTSGQLEIGIALVLQDRFSNQAREASSQIRKLHMDAKNAISANLQAIQSVAQQGQDFSRAAAGAMASAVVDGSRYIDTMTSVKAITGGTKQEMDKLNDTALSIGIETMFNSEQVASGMKYLAMAGTSAKDINESMRGIAMVAGATGMELAGKGGAADMITNVMRMFQIDAASAAAVIGDQLTKATLSANISMYDMAEAIKYAGADMTMLKQDLPAVAAMIGTLGNAGIQGSMAGTALSNMMRYLSTSLTGSNKKGAEALASVGLSMQDMVDSKGDLLDISTIIDKLLNASESLGSIERTDFFGRLFGVRGKRAGSAIANDIDGYRDLLRKIQSESTGFASEVMDERMSSLAGSINKVTTSWANARTQFAIALAPTLKPVLNTIAYIFEGVRSFLSIPFVGPAVTSFAAFSVIGIGLLATLTKLRTMWLFFKNDSQVKPSSWLTLLTGQWSGVLLKAKQYLAIQNAIIAQQKGGIAGNPVMGTLLTNPGSWVGNAKMTMSKTGKPIYWVRNASGGVTRATMSAAEKAAGGAGNAVRTLMGSTAAATGAASVGVAARLAGVGGKILGFISGPWGMALMAGMTLLPIIAPAISNLLKSNSKNSSSLDKNTEAVNRQTEISNKLIEATGGDTNDKLIKETRNLAYIIQYWGQKITSDPDKSIEMKNIITIDGKILQEHVEKIVNQNDKKISFSFNTK